MDLQPTNRSEDGTFNLESLKQSLEDGTLNLESLQQSFTDSRHSVLEWLTKELTRKRYEGYTDLQNRDHCSSAALILMLSGEVGSKYGSHIQASTLNDEAVDGSPWALRDRAQIAGFVIDALPQRIKERSDPFNEVVTNFRNVSERCVRTIEESVG